jgi:Suppressor of fused protein (SUFU)
MPSSSTILADDQFQALQTALKRFAAGASKVSYTNYQCTHDSKRKLGVMSAADLPHEGFTTAASFGLAQDSWAHANFPDRVELVQAWDNSDRRYERILVVVAETTMMLKLLPKPGGIYEDAVRVAGLADLARRMPHAMVLFPYSWKAAFESVDLRRTRVWFLQVVPIFEDEKNFIEKHGFKAFQELLSYHGPQLERLDRRSHIEL